MSAADNPPVDFGFGVQVTRDDVAADLESARERTEALQGKLQAGIISAVGRAAGFTAAMQRTAAQQIDGGLSAVADGLQRLQQPLAVPLVSDVSDAINRAGRFGAWPFDPADGLPPASVLEARAGLPRSIATIPPAMDGGPLVVDSATYQRAVADFTSNILPLRSNDFQSYGPALESLEARFPTGSRFWSLWQTTRDNLERETPVGVARSSVKLPATLPPTGDGQSASGQSGASGRGPFETPPIMRPTPVKPGAPVAGLPGGVFAPQQPGKPLPPVPPIQFPGQDNIPTFFASDGYGVIAQPDSNGQCPVGTFYGRVIPASPNGAALVGCVCAPGACGPQVPTPGFPPPLPLPGPVTGAPGQPPLPPPAPPVSCVQICGLDELIEALKKPCPEGKKYTLWRDGDTDKCYILPADQEPRSEYDEKLVTGSDPGVFVEAAISKCCDKPKRDEEPDRPGQGFPGAPVQLCDWILPANVTNFSGIEDPLGYLFGLVDANGKPIYAGGKDAPTGIVGTFWKYGLDTLRSFWKGPWDALNGILKGSPCGSGAYLGQRLSLGVYNLLGGIFGDALEPLKLPLKQQSDYLCPLLMPGITDANAAYLANTIDEKTWRCWVRAANGRDELFNAVMEAGRAKLSPGQVVSLRLREKINDQQAANRLRELGYIKPGDFAEVMELAKYIPGPQDTVRFMLRDVEDQRIVTRFGMDSEFTEKYKGKLQDWAKAQGLDDETMLRYWRAHWSIPSPTQLYEMYHRLRNKPAGDPSAVSLEDIKTALQQQDILPFWIDKLLAVSFRPLRQVDVRRAYFTGSITLDRVLQAYQDFGFSDDDAQLLTEFQRGEKLRAFRSHPAVKEYAAGDLNSMELQARLSAEGAGTEEINTAIERGRSIARAKSRKACVSALKRRFMLSEFDGPDAISRLISQGVDTDVANSLAAGWQCEREARGKHLGASQLCKMLDKGIIDGPEFVSRLERAGWDRDSAAKLYWNCSSDIDSRRRKAEAQRIRGEQAQAEKTRKEAEKAQKQLSQAQERAAKEAKRLQDTNKAREAALITAGERWARGSGGELPASILRARALYRTLRNATAYPVDEIIRAIQTAAKDPDTVDSGDWEGSALRVLESSQITE